MASPLVWANLSKVGYWQIALSDLSIGGVPLNLGCDCDDCCQAVLDTGSSVMMGENIAPVPIEDHVKKECDGINECMMVGDKRKYNVALITLKAVGANGEVPGTDKLDAGALRVNPEVKKISEAMKDKTWIDTVTAAITSANANTKVCHNNAFKIG